MIALLLSNKRLRWICTFTIQLLKPLLNFTTETCTYPLAMLWHLAGVFCSLSTQIRRIVLYCPFNFQSPDAFIFYILIKRKHMINRGVNPFCVVRGDTLQWTWVALKRGAHKGMTLLYFWHWFCSIWWQLWGNILINSSGPFVYQSHQFGSHLTKSSLG